MVMQGSSKSLLGFKGHPLHRKGSVSSCLHTLRTCMLFPSWLHGAPRFPNLSDFLSDHLPVFCPSAVTGPWQIHKVLRLLSAGKITSELKRDALPVDTAAQSYLIQLPCVSDMNTHMRILLKYRFWFRWSGMGTEIPHFSSSHLGCWCCWVCWQHLYRKLEATQSVNYLHLKSFTEESPQKDDMGNIT